MKIIKMEERKMERKEILMSVLIGILLLTTAIQTIQLVGSSSAKAVVSSSPSSSVPSSSGASHSAQTNLQDLPSMVGGC